MIGSWSRIDADTPRTRAKQGFILGKYNNIMCSFWYSGTMCGKAEGVSWQMESLGKNE